MNRAGAVSGPAPPASPEVSRRTGRGRAEGVGEPACSHACAPGVWTTEAGVADAQVNLHYNTTTRNFGFPSHPVTEHVARPVPVLNIRRPTVCSIMSPSSSRPDYGIGAALGSVEVAAAGIRRAGAEAWEAEMIRRALRFAVCKNYGDEERADEEMKALLACICNTPSRGLARLYQMPEVYDHLRRVVAPPVRQLARKGTGTN